MMSKEKILEIVIMQSPIAVGFIWWAAGEKAKVYITIDALKDNLKETINQIDKRLDLHIQDSHAARDSLTEKISGQGKRFGSKFERVERYIELLVKRKIEGTNDEQ